MNMDLIDCTKAGYYGLDNNYNIFNKKHFNVKLPSDEEKANMVMFSLGFISSNNKKFKNSNKAIIVFYYDQDGSLYGFFNDVKKSLSSNNGICIQLVHGKKRDFRFFNNVIQDFNISMYALFVEKEDGTYDVIG